MIFTLPYSSHRVQELRVARHISTSRPLSSHHAETNRPTTLNDRVWPIRCRPPAPWFSRLWSIFYPVRFTQSTLSNGPKIITCLFSHIRRGWGSKSWTIDWMPCVRISSRDRIGRVFGSFRQPSSPSTVRDQPRRNVGIHHGPLLPQQHGDRSRRYTLSHTHRDKSR
jgi:hypothetical protein